MKIFSLFIGFCMLLLFVSCTSEKPKETIPNNLIAKEKMAQLLSDLCLMEGAINVQTIQNQIADTSGLRFNLFKQHQVSRNQFDSSLAYYSKHLEDFKEIQVQVLEELNRKK